MQSASVMAVARVYELAPLLVRGCPTKPPLGVLQGVEGSVPDPGHAGDLVSLPLAVAGGSLSFPGYRVLLLLDPTVLYVAGQVSLLIRGEVKAAFNDIRRVRRWGRYRDAAELSSAG